MIRHAPATQILHDVRCCAGCFMPLARGEEAAAWWFEQDLFLRVEVCYACYDGWERYAEVGLCCWVLAKIRAANDAMERAGR